MKHWIVVFRVGRTSAPVWDDTERACEVGQLKLRHVQPGVAKTLTAAPVETSAALVAKFAPDRLAVASFAVGDPAVFATAADRPALVLKDALSTDLRASGQALRIRLRDIIERGAVRPNCLVRQSTAGNRSSSLSHAYSAADN